MQSKINHHTKNQQFQTLREKKKKRQSSDANMKMIWIMELSDKDFKAAIIKKCLTTQVQILF
jgi:hypothetical protein